MTKKIIHERLHQLLVLLLAGVAKLLDRHLVPQPLAPSVAYQPRRRSNQRPRGQMARYIPTGLIRGDPMSGVGSDETDSGNRRGTRGGPRDPGDGGRGSESHARGGRGRFGQPWRGYCDFSSSTSRHVLLSDLVRTII